jgi:hypothetical protein
MFSVFENIKINDYEQFANNMNYNFSGPMENDTHYKQPQHFFNNSMILNLGRFIKDIEIQGFKKYNFEKNEDLDKYRPNTYLNMSEIGTKINPGKLFT